MSTDDYESPDGYELYNFETVANALHEVRRQHHSGKPLTWTGPDNIHFSMAATTPPPSDYFSPDGLEYARDRGRGFWDAFIQVAFMFGWHNGTLREEQRQKVCRESDQRALDTALDALELGQTERAIDILRFLRRVR